MSNENKNDDWEVEEMLRRLPVAGPSHELDQRIAGLFQPRWKMWIGPLAGFAAGAAATAAVFLLAPRGVTHQVEPRETSVVENPTPAAVEAPRPALMITNQQVRSLADGDVNGYPAQIERTQSHLVFLQKADNGTLMRADVALPEQTFVHTVQSY